MQLCFSHTSDQKKKAHQVRIKFWKFTIDDQNGDLGYAKVVKCGLQEPVAL
jgi:hypothetical protein